MFMTGVLCTVCGAQVYFHFLGVICRFSSLPEKLFYAVVHRTTKMPIFTSPAKFLVVLMKKFRSFSKYIMDMYTCNYRTQRLNEPNFIGYFVLNVVYLIL